MASGDDLTYHGAHLDISPRDCLAFNVTDSSRDTMEIINLTNSGAGGSGAVVAFKIKTTSPEKFKVKPSMGVIRPGGHAEVAIYLSRGEYDIALEKFLVCSMVIGSIPKTQEQLRQLWVSAREETIAGHILQTKHQAASPRSEMDYLINTNKKLERKLTRIHLIQLTVLLSLTGVFMGIVLGLIPNPFQSESEKPNSGVFPAIFE